MNEAIQNLLNFFGLLPDTATMTLGDCFVYMVLAIFAIISTYLCFSFFYGVIRFFFGVSNGGDKI